ncbi:MAG TPA: aminotransferase class I/II-fold pyridoxal phosphate-dependent enzyme [Gemmatimonadaceae bacterium]|jgi:8-amino-7-oxononanoate synthase|nr:aminotransferase class I/II-fold pyridoxal phosphate-dependent enzyme [Gemmatimonadaceae bacterium]
MRELQELSSWFDSIDVAHDPLVPETLPDPSFVANGQRFVSFSTNNYLGLATSPRLKARARAALETFGVGNCESRLLGGNLELYEQLEARLAEVKRKEAALLFATGYLTNLGVLPALVRSGQMARAAGYSPTASWKHAFFTDEFNHLSIREGIRASGAPSIAYRHADMSDLERKLSASAATVKIIVTDGVFSQHGDIVPLPDMMALAERFDAIVYIDDAHGTGVLGPNGGGTTEHFGIDSPRIINMGTLSKAYGCIGGFVATEAYVTKLLRAGCSAYGFTSTLPPDQAAAVLEAIDMVRDEPERRERMWDNQRYFVAQIRAAGFALAASETPIVPLCVGDERECARLASALRDRHIHVDAILFPAVAHGQSRLRFIVNANHTRQHIDDVVSALRDATA